MSFKNRVIIFLLVFIIIFENSSTVFAEREELLPSGIHYDDIGSEIDKFVQKHKATTAAFGVGIFDGDSIIYKNLYGYSDIENEMTADFETVFEWGSVTKLLVWTSVMQLWEDGKIELNEDIKTYLPREFLNELSYEKPITMVDLMNHKAGFQDIIYDIMIKDEENIFSLKDALLSNEPAQIYEPNTVAGYSNYSTALAAFVVEEISGIPFYEYVHKNIFMPLGMNNTALNVDLSDNKWVQEKRKELKNYNRNRELLPDMFRYINIYPAGMCTGTLDDFIKFGQALVPKEETRTPLFKSKDTLLEMLSPTAMYEGSDLGSNSHGFWTQVYKVSVLGHGGNTAGCSSYLNIDPESGIGVVIFTNQQGEMIYNMDFQELIFGSFKDSIYYESNKELPKGLFKSARTIEKGPFSIYGLNFIELDEKDYDEFWTYQEIDGKSKIISPYFDKLKFTTPEIIIKATLLIPVLLGSIYALITLVFG